MGLVLQTEGSAIAHFYDTTRGSGCWEGRHVGMGVGRGEFRLIGAYADTSRLITGTHSEESVVRRYRRCANVIQCTYTNRS